MITERKFTIVIGVLLFIQTLVFLQSQSQYRELMTRLIDQETEVKKENKRLLDASVSLNDKLIDVDHSISNQLSNVQASIAVSSKGAVTVAPTPLYSFLDAAKKAGTDKVTDHSYQYTYEQYLPSLRSRRIKMLEIGLGCDMSYGPGKSLALWLDYFSVHGVDLHFMEYDANCVAKWASSYPNIGIYAGDQASEKDMQNVIDKSNAIADPFDIIIDDGGHTWKQQQVSMEYFWPKILKPGGYYFIEDLQTSFMPFFIDENNTKGHASLTTVNWIKTLLDLLYFPGYFSQTTANAAGIGWATDIIHIDCRFEICLFEKKK